MDIRELGSNRTFDSERQKQTPSESYKCPIAGRKKIHFPQKSIYWQNVCIFLFPNIPPRTLGG